MQQFSNIINNPFIKATPPVSAHMMYNYDPHSRLYRTIKSNPRSGKVKVNIEIILNTWIFLVNALLSSICAENIPILKNREYISLKSLKEIPSDNSSTKMTVQ